MQHFSGEIFVNAFHLLSMDESDKTARVDIDYLTLFVIVTEKCCSSFSLQF